MDKAAESWIQADRGGQPVASCLPPWRAEGGVPHGRLIMNRKILTQEIFVMDMNWP